MSRLANARLWLASKIAPPSTQEIVRIGPSRLFGAMDILGAGDEPRPPGIDFDQLRMIEQEPQAAISLALVQMPIVAVNWRISSQSDAVAKATDEALRAVWLPYITAILQSLPFGYMGVEKRWKYNHGRWVWDEPLQVKPEDIYIKRNGNSFAGFWQGKGPDRPFVPAAKAYVFSHDRAKVHGNMYGRPRTYASLQYSWVKKHIMRFTSLYYEQTAQPMMEGRAPANFQRVKADGTPETVDGMGYLYDEVITKLTAGKKGYVLTSTRDDKGNFIWDIIQKELTQRGVDYIKFLEYLDIMISRGIVVPDLMAFQNLRTGSRAMSSSHGEVFWVLECGLLDQIKWSLENHLIRQFIDYNFGVTAPDAFWDYEPLAPETIQWLKEVIDRMVAKGTATVDLAEVSNRLGVKISEVTPPAPIVGPRPTKIPEDGRKNKPKLEDLHGVSIW